MAERQLTLVDRDDSPDAEAIVSVTSNPRGHLLIGELRAETGRSTALVDLEALPSASPAESAPTVSLVRTLLHEQSEPILDAATVGDTLLLLTPHAVTRSGGEDSAPVTTDNILPRDVRGRLVIENDALRVWLPGVFCDGQWRPQLELSCRDQSVPWPLAPGPWPLGLEDVRLAPGRNYFTHPELERFFQIADIGEFRIATHPDGSARLYDRQLQPVRALTGWDSEIAGVADPCGDGQLVLASAADSVRAFALRNTRPVPVSQPLEFPGAVTALWPADSHHAATAVIHNLETDRYAAFHLDLRCRP